MPKFQLMAGEHIGKHPTRKENYAVPNRFNADGSPYTIQIPAECKWKTGDVLEASGKDAVALMQLANKFRQVPDSVPATRINDPMELTEIAGMEFTPVYLDPQLPLPETTHVEAAPLGPPPPPPPAKPSNAEANEVLAHLDDFTDLDEVKRWSQTIGVDTNRAKSISQARETIKKAKGW